MGVLFKLWAFIKRDFQSEVSYRLSFVLQVGGMFVSLLAFFYMTGMIDPDAKGLDGIRPFDWMLVGLCFQFYFSAALFAFSQKIRDEQMLGTLEAPGRPMSRRQHVEIEIIEAFERRYPLVRVGAVHRPPRQRPHGDGIDHVRNPPLRHQDNQAVVGLRRPRIEQPDVETTHIDRLVVADETVDRPRLRALQVRLGVAVGDELAVVGECLTAQDVVAVVVAVHHISDRRLCHLGDCGDKTHRIFQRR